MEEARSLLSLSLSLSVFIPLCLCLVPFNIIWDFFFYQNDAVKPCRLSLDLQEWYHPYICDMQLTPFLGSYRYRRLFYTAHCKLAKTLVHM